MAAAASNNVTYAPLDMGVRIKLSVMMFLQFATWGAWFVVMGNYLGTIFKGAPESEVINALYRVLHFLFGIDKPADDTAAVIGAIYSTMPLGTIFAPIFMGQIADRFFSSEKLMAVLHLAGAGLLYWLAQIKDVDTFFLVALAYAFVYSPTLALSNSIAFSHVPNATRDFPSIRVMGTIGWIAANLLLKPLMDIKDQNGFSLLPNAPFLLAAAFSWILGVFSFSLPHTPPPGKPGDALPFLKALGLFKEFSFAVFFVVSFVITIVLAFYYGFTGVFLETRVLIAPDLIGPLMTIGQLAELCLLPFLPFFLNRFGMKWVLTIGMFCWGLRYAMFSCFAAYANPNDFTIYALYPLVLTGIALHGICFDFFFAAAFIHVDNKAPAEIRGSGQALFTFLTYGIGMWIGNILSGLLGDLLTDPTGTKDWALYWIIPSAGVFLCLAIFLLFFRDRKDGRTAM